MSTFPNHEKFSLKNQYVNSKWNIALPRIKSLNATAIQTLPHLALFRISSVVDTSDRWHGARHGTQVRRWQNNFCTRTGRWRRTVTKHERQGGGKGGWRRYAATVESRDWDYSRGDRGVAAGNVFADWRAVVEAVLFHALYVDVSSAKLWSRNFNEQRYRLLSLQPFHCCNADFFCVTLCRTFNLQSVTAVARHTFPFCGNEQTSYVLQF